MTINGYNRAKELEALIEESERDSKCLRGLIDRIEELSKNNSQFSSVNIQISEKWMNTPTAYVDVNRLLEFLTNEIKMLNDKMVSYYKEFEEL